MRAVLRIFRKTSWPVALLLIGACAQIPVSQQPTKPAEPPPVTATPPTPVVQEPLPMRRGMKAALLVPMTGQAGAVGQSLFNAAQLALFEVGGDAFSIQPFDTKGTPEGAVKAAESATAQGADILLGPLFSADVKAAAPLAVQAGTPMVSFTTDRSAAGNGVFVLGFLPRSQVARVVGHARAHGISRFAVLAPDNDYGRTMANAYQAVVTGSGAMVTRAEFYDPRADDFSAAAERLTAGGPGAFEALLLPDSPARVRKVAAALTAQGVDPARVQLLGTMLWADGATLAGEPAVAGAWYPAPPQAAHEDFMQSYQRAFGTRPPAIASLAYDATAVAAVLARRPTPDFTPATLTQPGGFAGVDGIFRLLPDGTNQRGLAVMQLTPNGPREVSPAPSDFNGPIF